MINNMCSYKHQWFINDDSSYLATQSIDIKLENNCERDKFVKNWKSIKHQLILILY